MFGQSNPAVNTQNAITLKADMPLRQFFEMYGGGDMKGIINRISDEDARLKQLEDFIRKIPEEDGKADHFAAGATKLSSSSTEESLRANEKYIQELLKDMENSIEEVEAQVIGNRGLFDECFERFSSIDGELETVYRLIHLIAERRSGSQTPARELERVPNPYFWTMLNNVYERMSRLQQMIRELEIAISPDKEAGRRIGVQEAFQEIYNSFEAVASRFAKIHSRIEKMREEIRDRKMKEGIKEDVFEDKGEEESAYQQQKRRKEELQQERLRVERQQQVQQQSMQSMNSMQSMQQQGQFSSFQGTPMFQMGGPQQGSGQMGSRMGFGGATSQNQGQGQFQNKGFFGGQQTPSTGFGGKFGQQTPSTGFGGKFGQQTPSTGFGGGRFGQGQQGQSFFQNKK